MENSNLIDSSLENEKKESRNVNLNKLCCAGLSSEVKTSKKHQPSGSSTRIGSPAI